MSEELRSAFDIPGFLEGGVKISCEGSCYRFYMSGNNLKSVLHNGKEESTFLNAAKLFEEIWYPVPEPKPKMYRHTYKEPPCHYNGEEYRYISTVETSLDWEAFKNESVPRELINTEEVGE